MSGRTTQQSSLSHALNYGQSDDLEAFNETSFASEISDDEGEITQNIKMTTSPSLSALAGILEQKRQKKKFMPNESIRSGLESPQLISFENEPIMQTHDVDQGPDFLSTPSVKQDPTMSVNDYTHTMDTLEEVASPSLLGTPVVSSTKPMLHNHLGMKPMVPPKLAQPMRSKSAQDILPKKQHELSRTVSPAKSLPKHIKEDRRTRAFSGTLPQPTEERQKKSIFSFLKKKGSQRSVSQGGLANSQSMTFGELPMDTKLQKKSASSGSLFQNWRKKKENAAAAASIASPSPEPEHNDSFDEPYERTKYQSKESLLTEKFNQDNSFDYSESVLENTTEENEGLHNFAAGQDLFPKSLDPEEVTSIISLERTRSVKSARHSMSSNRLSLRDAISNNALQEGMYVMAADTVFISTPDASKSPTSSILRNGRFDDFTGIPEVGLPRDLSLTSVSEQIIHMSKDDMIPDDPSLSTVKQKDDDDRFVTDIMEFSNFIDFGGDLDVDFNVDSPKKVDVYHSLNPNLNRDDASVNSHDSMNFDNSRRLSMDPEIAVPAGFIPNYNRPDATNFAGLCAPTLNNNANSYQQGGLSSEPINSPQTHADSDVSTLSPNYKHAAAVAPVRPIMDYQSTVNSFQPENVSQQSDVNMDRKGHNRGDMYSTSNTSADSMTLSKGKPKQDASFRGANTSIESEKPLASPPYRVIHGATDHEAPVTVNRRSIYEEDGLKTPHQRPESFAEKPATPIYHEPENNFDSYTPSMVSSQRVSMYKTPTHSVVSIQPGRPKGVQFSSRIILFDTYSADEYNRHPEVATCNQLTPVLATMIKQELNELKLSWEVHPDSKIYTHFF